MGGPGGLAYRLTERPPIDCGGFVLRSDDSEDTISIPFGILKPLQDQRDGHVAGALLAAADSGQRLPMNRLVAEIGRTDDSGINFARDQHVAGDIQGTQAGQFFRRHSEAWSTQVEWPFKRLAGMFGMNPMTSLATIAARPVRSAEAPGASSASRIRNGMRHASDRIARR